MQIETVFSVRNSAFIDTDPQYLIAFLISFSFRILKTWMVGSDIQRMNIPAHLYAPHHLTFMQYDNVTHFYSQTTYMFVKH